MKRGEILYMSVEFPPWNLRYKKILKEMKELLKDYKKQSFGHP